eukprot:188690-Rhodomonas_salina.1
MCGDGVGGAPSTLTANASAWGASAWGAEDALVSRAHGAGGAEDGGKSKEEFGWNSVLRKKVQAKLLRRTFAPYAPGPDALVLDRLRRCFVAAVRCRRYLEGCASWGACRWRCVSSTLRVCDCEWSCRYGAVYLSLCTDTLGRWKPADGMVVCFLSKAQADSAIEVRLAPMDSALVARS